MSETTLSGYFDYNATTPLSNSVKSEMLKALDIYGNASSPYSRAQESKALVDSARENMAQLMGAETSQMFFTSCGSEANNWAIKGSLARHAKNPGHIITTAIEHPSVLEPIAYMEQVHGFSVTRLVPDVEGRVREEDFLSALRPNTQFVSVMYANNETGALQPIGPILEEARRRAITSHTDAVQALGKCTLDDRILAADYVSFSAHKFYGPKGIGGLYVRRPGELAQLIHGGGQEMGLRAGTENLVGMAGLARASEDCTQLLPEWESHYRRLRHRITRKLQDSGLGIEFNGPQDPSKCVGNTINFSVPGVRGEALAALLDHKHQTQVSIGSACSNNKSSKSSHVLVAMGLGDERIQSAIRMSFGRYTTEDELDRFVNNLHACAEQLLGISTPS
ncbi:cysteine desulfurase family protein [Marinimicrobium locisalis]|uniref:cysteine desulfurase family protein n=1 Tax=Marinimicrobium locisalis TaxID=546022 RepID=UPI0032213AF8